MNLKYLGTVGDTADTPLGVKKTGEVFEVPDKQAPAWLSSGNYEQTDEPVKEAETPLGGAQPFGAAPTAAAAPGAAPGNFPVHDVNAHPGTPPVSSDKTTGPEQPTPGTITRP